MSALPLLVGCTPATLAVPADVASGTDVLEVTDRSSMSGALADESFKLGSYAVSDVDREWDSSQKKDGPGLDVEEAGGGYQFAFTAGKTKLKGGCSTSKSGKGKDLGGGMEFNMEKRRLNCFCSAGDLRPQVEVRNENDAMYVGKLKTSEGEYDIKSLDEVEGGMKPIGGPAGYRVDGGGVVGAVDAMNPGKVWLRKGMSEGERIELSCLFAGLMLYKPPSDG
jgi:hypothetical protein